MPQMAPIMWLLIIQMILVSLLIIMSQINFHVNITTFKADKQSKALNNTWKW